MIDLQLDVDEGLILQATEIERYGEREDVLDELILTNKNLIYSYEFKSGMFSKAETRVEKIPLEKIKVVNGKVQIMRVAHDDYCDVMQVLYVDGRREYFSFWNAKKDIPKWVNAINAAITGDDTPIVDEPAEKKKAGLFSSAKKEKAVQKAEPVERVGEDKTKSNSVDVTAGVNAFAAGLVNMRDSAVKKIDNATKQLSEAAKENPAVQQQEPVQPTPVYEPEVEKKSGNHFCTNCGEKLQVGAKFCHGCGAQVGQGAIPTAQATVEQPKRDESVRTQEYVGTVLKCVHCGGY